MQKTKPSCPQVCFFLAPARTDTPPGKKTAKKQRQQREEDIDKDCQAVWSGIQALLASVVDLPSKTDTSPVQNRLGTTFASAALAAGVSKTTLFRRFKEFNAIDKKERPTTLEQYRRVVYHASGRPPTLTREFEAVLAARLLYVSRLGFPVTRVYTTMQISKFLAENPHIVNTFKSGRPGKKWWRRFLAEHPKLSVKVPSRLSRSRAYACNQTKFFELLAGFDSPPLASVLPELTFNMDETQLHYNAKRKEIEDAKAAKEKAKKDVKERKAQERRDKTLSQH